MRGTRGSGGGGGAATRALSPHRPSWPSCPLRHTGEDGGGGLHVLPDGPPWLTPGSLMLVDHSRPLAAFVVSVGLFTLRKATGWPPSLFDGGPAGLPEDSQPHAASGK